MPQTVLAVIGCINYEGAVFDTLRLFDCRSTAKAYAEELEQELCIDYVLVEERVISFESALATA